MEMLLESHSEMGKSHEKPYGCNVFAIIMTALLDQLLADAEMGVGQHL